MKNKKDVEFMELAIKQAQYALKLKEIPVGAIITKNSKIISVGFNKREKTKNSLAHAEIVAINSACKKLKSWRILNSTIYVTLEPCIMCAGAIINAKIERIVFGAKSNNIYFNNPKDLKKIYETNKIEVVSGVCNKKCEYILKTFFKTLRKKSPT